ncbi:CDP-glucose 4,6-dehydratase [Sphingosinicellaceae bacterium]|nr:CDP-glucose 4,6-dehydratase [Sphingosinicellaceae bacterium]
MTGHTGFKGSWMSLWLERLGATVHGYALAPDHVPDLFSRLSPFEHGHSTIADLADRAALAGAVTAADPTVIIHMAAQPLVRRSYDDPVETFATNIMGTVNVLEAARHCARLRAVLVVTTDKVYRNEGDGVAFVEADRLGGSDPYSASKACCELVTASYAQSFLAKSDVQVATARAGNVVGGGDWSVDRLVPDVWRAIHAGRTLELRYPTATRPWQHVLDPVAGYLLYAEHLSGVRKVAETLNFGPHRDDSRISVAEVAAIMAASLGSDRPWQSTSGNHPPEMTALALDATAAEHSLGWRPRLAARDALRWTAEWFRGFDAGDDVRRLSLGQLETYEALR